MFFFCKNQDFFGRHKSEQQKTYDMYGKPQVV